MANTNQNKRKRGAKGGAELLFRFLEKHALTYDHAATRLGTNRGTVCGWATGKNRPRHEWRLALEVYSRGAVPAPSWFSDVEAEVAELATPWDEEVEA